MSANLRIILFCRHAAEAISEKMDRPQSLGRRLALWTHLLMCGACRLYLRQIKEIQKWLRSNPELGGVEQLPPQSVARIQNRINDQAAAQDGPAS